MSSTLDEICKFYSGTGFPNKFQGKTNGKYPFVKVGDISRTVKKGNITLTKSQNYINNDVVNKINGKIVPKDTIIFAKIGEALKLNRRVITNKECLIDNNILGIKPKTNKIDLKYLFYFMNHLKLEKFSESTTVPSVRQTRLKSITINIPSIDEQLEIVNILENINKAVLLKREQLSKLDILIKARFVEMFGDPIKVQPDIQTWSLKSIATVKSSHRIFTKEFVNSGVPFYRGTEISMLAAGNIPKHPYYISRKRYDEIAADDSKPKIGDLLLPSICDKGQLWLVNTDKPFYYKDGRVLCISLNKQKFNPIFFHEYMKLKLKAEYSKLGSGSTFAEFKIFQLKKLKIFIPSMKLQNEFANFVQQVDKSKVAVQKSLDETQKLYDSLMQEYFG